MYQPSASTRDRIVTFGGVLAIHVILLGALINLSGPVREALPDQVVEIFDVIEPPPPPPPPPPTVVETRKVETPKPKEKEAKASEKNIKSKATEVKVVEPRIPLPVPTPTPAAKTPNNGNEATQGASNQAGAGTGAGGSGNGTGSGGAGNGTGGGGGGIANPSRILRKLGRRDFPPGVIERTPRGGRIFTRLRIEADGRVSQCDVMRSFGDANADQWTCSLIRQRAVFQPATDRSGRPVASWFGYVQEF